MDPQLQSIWCIALFGVRNTFDSPSDHWRRRDPSVNQDLRRFQFQWVSGEAPCSSRVRSAHGCFLDQSQQQLIQKAVPFFNKLANSENPSTLVTDIFTFESTDSDVEMQDSESQTKMFWLTELMGTIIGLRKCLCPFRLSWLAQSKRISVHFPMLSSNSDHFGIYQSTTPPWRSFRFMTRSTISIRFWVSDVVLAPPSLGSVSKAPCTSNEIVRGSIGTFGGQVPSGHVACLPLKVQRNEVVATISMLRVSSIFHSFWWSVLICNADLGSLYHITVFPISAFFFWYFLFIHSHRARLPVFLSLVRIRFFFNKPPFMYEIKSQRLQTQEVIKLLINSGRSTRDGLHCHCDFAFTQITSTYFTYKLLWWSFHTLCLNQQQNHNKIQILSHADHHRRYWLTSLTWTWQNWGLCKV